MIEFLLALALMPATPTVTIRAEDINRDPMAVTRRLQARGLRVWAFAAPATPDAVDTVVDVRAGRVIESGRDPSVHDEFDEAAEQRAELARLRMVKVTRHAVRIPADYPYDLQIFVGRAPYNGLDPMYDTHGRLPIQPPIEVMRRR